MDIDGSTLFYKRRVADQCQKGVSALLQRELTKETESFKKKGEYQGKNGKKPSE